VIFGLSCGCLLNGVGRALANKARDAKSMTARSPDDSAGEHNKGSRWTASLPSEGGMNGTQCSGMSFALAASGVCGYVRGHVLAVHNPNATSVSAWLRMKRSEV
jgi:hypothetical protein